MQNSDRRDSPATAANFDGLAPFYDALTFVVFGHRLQRAQTVFLEQIPADALILMVGGGTGWLLEQVLTRCQPRRVIYLEASARMLARASRRLLNHSVTGTVDFRVGDETSLQPDERVDVILTPFVLDLFSDETLRTKLIPPLYRALKPGGLWLITDFVQPQTSGQKALLWTMIRFFRLTTGIEARQLADWQQCLAATGLQRRSQQTQLRGMVATEVWERPPL